MLTKRLFLTLALGLGLTFSILSAPPLLVRSISDTVAAEVKQPSLINIATGQQRSRRPLSPPSAPLHLPDNPTLNPISNTHTAPATSTVSITYDEAIDPATVSTRTFAVFAMQTGLISQSYSVAGGTIRLTPPQPFKPGELVQVSATTGTLNLSGQGPLSSTVWQFRVAPTGGYGHFSPSGQTFPFSDTVAVALGDLDKDGDLDAFVGNWDFNEIWLNQGDGTFTQTPQNLGSLAVLHVALGDLDGDSDLDIFAGSADVSDHDEIWLNNGSGIFTKSNQGLSSSSHGGLALGDLDGDGDLDAFVGHAISDKADQVWLNDGAGVFTDSGQRLGNSDTSDIALGGLDGDGDLDAFAVNGGLFGNQPNQVWLNDGAGIFTNPYPGLGNSASGGVALGDLDEDGDLDAFVTHRRDQASEVWLNDGAGSFTDSGQRLGQADSLVVELGDIDGDGDLDAIIGNLNSFNSSTNEGNSIWLNNGRAVFSAKAQRLGRASSAAIALGDLDGDSDLDVFVGHLDFEGLFLPPSPGAPNKVWLNTRPVYYFPVIFKF